MKRLFFGGRALDNPYEGDNHHFLEGACPRPFQSRQWDRTFERLNSAASSDRLEERFSQVCSEIGRRKHGPVCDVLVSATSHFGWHALHRLANEATL